MNILLRLQNSKYKIPILITLVLIDVSLAFVFFKNREVQVAALHLDAGIIEFPYTDENKDETLIIKTDKEIYEGESSADVFISITNTTENFEKIVILFYFPKPPEGESAPQLETLEQRNENNWRLLPLFKSSIKINEELLKNALKKREIIPEEQEIRGGSQIEIPAGQTSYLKLKISFPVGSTGEFWVEAIGQNGGYGLLDPMFVSRGGTKIGQTTTSRDTTPGWYSGSWSYRKRITIDKKKVSGTSDLSSFPVLISRTDTDFKHTSFGGNVASSSAGPTGGGGDFVFTSSDGTTKIDHEIEKYASSSGEIIAWVEVPTLSVSSDTVLYVYYGGPSTGATNQNVTGVWDTNYIGVWHLPGTTTLTALDSTSNGNNGTITKATLVSGKIDGAASVSATSTYINCTDAACGGTTGGKLDIGTRDFTVSAWVKPKTSTGGAGFGSGQMFISKIGDSEAGWYLAINQLYFTVGLRVTVTTEEYVTAQDGITTPVNEWNYVTAVFDRDGNLIRYVNGQQTGTLLSITNASTDSVDHPYTACIVGGRDGDGTGCDSRAYDGHSDEVRVSQVVRSADWIKTEYNNQSKPSLFYMVGGQQSRTSSTTKIGQTTTSRDTTPGWYSGSWSYRKRITIDKKKVSGTSDLSSFPVLISRTDPDFKHTSFGGNVASSSAGLTGGGGDFVFTSSDGTTKIDHEIEKYASSSGEIIAWVEVPTLSVSADTVLYVYYGGPSTGATNQNKTGTWNSNYVGVWHLGEGDSTASNFYKDSTSNASHGTLTDADGDSIQATGQIGTGMAFNGDADYITTGTTTAFGDFTACAWFKDPSGAGSYERIIDKRYDTGFWLGRNSNTANSWGGGVLESLAPFGRYITLRDGSWRYLCSVRNGTTHTIIGDSGGVTTQGTVSATATGTAALRIAAEAGVSAASYTNATIDEIHVSDTVRSSGWIATEYNNQSKPSTFYMVGGQQKRF